VHLPTTPSPGQDAVVKYLGKSDAWHTYFLPGLRVALGPLWWLIVAGTVAGLVGVIVVRSRRTHWWIGFVGLVSLVAYVFSPQILSLRHRPYWFVVNVRYLAPTLALGLICLPLALGPRRKVSQYLFGGYLVVLGVTLAARTVWLEHARTLIALPTHGSAPKVLGVVVGIVGAALGTAVIFVRRRDVRVSPRVWLPACVAIVVIAGFGVDRYYVQHRYTDLRGFGWARHVHDARIGIVNLLPQYQLYGSDLSNHVQYVANRGVHGKSTSIATCSAWRSALRDGRYTYAVVTSPDFAYPSSRVPPAVAWTRSDPGARLVLTDRIAKQGEWVFQLRQPPDPTTCPGGGTAKRGRAPA
jgi:hypothetical protein